MNTPFIRPQSLREGDKIAILSPAGIVRPEFVENSINVLRHQGWDPYVSTHALGRHGSFSGTIDERYSDMEEALLNPEVKAILCTRGGYGAVHLLDRLNRLPLRHECAKWLIGFSDISALHALMSSHGIMSLHASMTKRLSQTGGDDDASQALFSMLRGGNMNLQFEPHPLNRTGSVTAPITGGNLIVTSSLLSTPFSPFRPGAILFIEDIAEPIYKVERVLMQLKLSGILSQAAGLIVGQFTGYEPDANHRHMYEMISKIVADCNIPIAFNAPIGHIDTNQPILYGTTATLTVTPTSVKLMS